MKKRNKSSSRRMSMGYILIIPSTLLMLVISIYPLLNGIYLSMTNQHFLKPKQNDFIWFGNFKSLLVDIKPGGNYENAPFSFGDPEFYSALGFSFLYAFCVVFIAYVLGLFLASLLNKDIWCRGLLRAVILIPWIVPPTVAATNWLWVLDTHVGVINTTLKSLGLIENSIQFLADPNIIKATVIVIGSWKAFPFMMITLLAGLQGIPSDLYEAARIDGANAVQSFLRITLPILKPVSFVSITLMFIWTFNNFENIYLLTYGGPVTYSTTMPIHIYKTAFFKNNISYASAIAVLMMVCLIVFAVIYLKVLFGNKNKDYS